MRTIQTKSTNVFTAASPVKSGDGKSMSPPTYGLSFIDNNPVQKKEGDANSVTLPADIGGAMAPLQKKSAASEVVQGFFMHNGLRVSDDGRLAVTQEQGRGGHAAYAEAGAAAASNNSRPNSRVLLYNSAAPTVQFPNRTNTAHHNLNQVLARNTVTGTQGDNMTLERDCGVSSSQVMGGYNHAYANGNIAGMGPRRGVHSGNQVTAQTGDPAQMQLTIMETVFNRMLADTVQFIQQDNARMLAAQQEEARLGLLINQITALIGNVRNQLQASQNQAHAAGQTLHNLSPLYQQYSNLETGYRNERNYCGERLNEYRNRVGNRRYDQRDVEDGIRHYRRRLDDAQDALDNFYAYRLAGGTVRQLLNTYEDTQRDFQQNNQQVFQLQAQIIQLQHNLQQAQQSLAQEQQARQQANNRITANRQWELQLRLTILQSAMLAGNAEAKANVYINVFRTLPANFRDQQSQASEINEFAMPDVGEAYVIARGGVAGGVGGGWNFHWGGVVLKSGNDTVTLENDASTMPVGANRGWRFQMYGTHQQSFHAQNNNGVTYNSDPTTIRVRL
ncbi:MAG: hypothetical protein ACOYXT_15360 [Bacteroidota bacterium]